MNFEDFWKKIQSTGGEIELVTLSQKKPFSFSYNHSSDTIDIIPSYKTKDPRASRKKDLKKIWDVAKTVTKPYSPSNYHDITFNSSYIVSIMKYIINDENLE